MKRRKKGKKNKQSQEKKVEKKISKNGINKQNASIRAFTFLAQVLAHFQSYNRYKITLSLITILLILLPSICYLLLSSVSPTPHASLSGLDILTDCEDEIACTVMLSPYFSEEYVKVGVSIDNSEKIIKKCSTFKFILPGPTIRHRYKISNEFSEEPGSVLLRGIEDENRILEDVHREQYGYDILCIDLKKLPNFTGFIEYVWVKGIQRTSYSEYQMLLPFTATTSYNEKLKGVKRFRVSIPVDRKYRLREHSLELSGQKAIAQMFFYWFDVDSGRSTLHLVFEDHNRTQWKQHWQTLFIILFGVGIGLLITEVVSFIRKRKPSL